MASPIVVEGVARERLDKLAFLVCEVGQQRIAELVSDILQPGEVIGFGAEADQGAVDRVQHCVDDVMLLLQPVQHWAEPLVPGPQVRENGRVFGGVMLGDHPGPGSCD